MSDTVLIVKEPAMNPLIAAMGLQGPPGPSGLLADDADVDFVSIVPQIGNVLALLPSGKWGPVNRDDVVDAKILVETNRAGNAEANLGLAIIAETNRATAAEANRALDADVVHIVGNEVITGGKNYTGYLRSGGIDVETIVGSQAKADAAVVAASAYTDANYVNILQKGAANGVAPLDANSLISNVFLPPLAITDTFPVVNQAAMLALAAERGDVAVRTDINKSFILRFNDPTVLGNWQELLTPVDSVTSVNGQIGVVGLVANDIPFASTTGIVAAIVGDALDELHTDITTGLAGPAGGVLAGNYPNPGFAPAPTFTGLVSIVAPNASTIPLLVQGAASQSAHLQDWSDSSGTVIANVDSVGVIRTSQYFGSTVGAKATLIPNFDTGALGIKTNADANKGLVIRRNSVTQSANLFEAQTDSGTVRLVVDASGRLAVGASSPSSTAGIFVSPTSASVVPSIVKAFASQTANLQEWQDSAGTVLSNVNSNGRFNGAFGAIASGKAVLSSNADTGGFVITTAADANKGLTIRRNSSSQTANLFEIQSESGVVNTGIDVSGRIFRGSGPLNSAALSILPSNSSSIGVVFRAQASQSNDLTQWQDSGGGTVAAVGSSGHLVGALFRGTNTTTARLTPAGDTGGMLITTLADANKGLVIRRNSATQSANIQEWQDESSGIMASMNAAAQFVLGSVAAGAKFHIASGFAINALINPTSATSVPLVLKGAASQSGDLQQWQNSAGANLSKVSSGGHLSLITGVNSSIFNAVADSPSVVVATLRGAGSQTADLFQLADTNQVVLSKFNANGGFQSYGVTHTLSNLAVPTGVAAGAPAAGGAFAAGTYFWVVTATNAAGETTKSAEVTATPALNQQVAISWTQVTGATGYKVYRSTVSGTYTTPALVATITNGTTVSYTDTGTAVGAGAPPGFPLASAQKQLVLQAWANATTHLFEIQNSAGTAVSKIYYDGTITAGASAPTSAYLNVGGSVATAPLAILKAAASQSANLQEWQDSSGAVLTSIANTGNVNTTGSFGAVTSTKARLQPNYDTGGFGIFTQADANKGLVIRRNSSSQTANPFEIQKEDGVIYWAAKPNGAFTLDGGANGGNAIAGGAISGVGTAITANSSTGIPLAIKSAASQTGDLFRVLDSSAAVLHAITAAGLPKWAAASTVQTTVGAAGGAAALPVLPTKYLKVVDDAGTTLVIPAYLAA